VENLFRNGSIRAIEINRAHTPAITPLAVSAFSIVQGRKSFSGSSIGGIKETQEMLDFCSKHNIVSDIEMSSFDKIEEAWERVIKGDVKYRFVLDLKTLKS
jgi:uncharacterized zinc-type alcohol dehydrogenase-like protein